MINFELWKSVFLTASHFCVKSVTFLYRKRIKGAAWKPKPGSYCSLPIKTLYIKHSWVHPWHTIIPNSFTPYFSFSGYVSCLLFCFTHVNTVWILSNQQQHLTGVTVLEYEVLETSTCFRRCNQRQKDRKKKKKSQQEGTDMACKYICVLDSLTKECVLWVNG